MTTPDTTSGPGIFGAGVPSLADAPELAHVRAMFEDDHATRTLGITIDTLGIGSCSGTFTVTNSMCNGHRTAHGGFLYAFADSLFAGACNSLGQPAVAAHNSIHYLAPAFAGDQISGSAAVVSTWGRNGIVDVTLHRGGDSEQVIAQFRGTFRVVPARP